MIEWHPEDRIVLSRAAETAEALADGLAARFPWADRDEIFEEIVSLISEAEDEHREASQR